MTPPLLIRVLFDLLRDTRPNISRILTIDLNFRQGINHNSSVVQWGHGTVHRLGTHGGFVDYNFVG